MATVNKLTIYNEQGVATTYDIVDEISGYIKVIPTASPSTLGGVKVGTGLSINSSTGVLSLGTASTSQIGGVKVDGTTIKIQNGVISSLGGITYEVIQNL